MPMSQAFERRLHPILPDIVKRFGTPFHIYDEQGIRDTAARLLEAFHGVPGFREFYAVKALPNPAVLEILREFGFGYDCSSPMEIEIAEQLDAQREDVMFTSNATLPEEFEKAMDAGAIINFDDVSFLDDFPGAFPELACFRFNPGAERTGNSIIGNPVEAKYGITRAQFIPAYRRARELGASRFGIHTMVCSNQRDHRYMVETVRMLLKLAGELENELGIRAEFVNMGGGIGIPYKPRQKEFDIEALGRGVRTLLLNFKHLRGWQPKVFMESGRYITGPHGALVAKVTGRKEIYQTHVSVDAGMPALMRHAIYGAYHHVTVLNGEGRPKETVNVVGSICENCDRLATQRRLPKTVKGDILMVHDTGAHGIAMGFNYNGRTRPQELLLRADGSVKRIRRAETTADLWHTLIDFDRRDVATWRPARRQ